MRAVHEHREPEKVIISAPVYIDRGTGEAGRIYRYEGWRRRRLDPIPPGGVAAPTVVITSGSLVNAIDYQALGGVDESLFIDYVDHDFCLRAVIAGFHIIICADANLYHAIGKAVMRRLPMGRFWFSSGHSSSRRYTISRNRREMIRRYLGSFPCYALWLAIEYFKDVLGIMLCEQNRSEKLGMMWRGFRESGKYFRRGHGV